MAVVAEVEALDLSGMLSPTPQRSTRGASVEPLMQGLNRPRYADDAFDAAKLERRLLLDDHPRPPIELDNVTNLRIGPVAEAHPIRTVRSPQNDFKGGHA